MAQYLRFGLRLQPRQQSRFSSSIRNLQDSFRNPSSPFYLAPGTQGPDSPESSLSSVPPAHEHPSVADAARNKLIDLGYDPSCFWEQKIVWGDHDSFHHVNNVRYVRFFESGRVEYMRALGNTLGGPAKAEAMIKGQGVSLIIKSISVNFKRPVRYPDTLLIGHKPYLPDEITQPKYHFNCRAIAYSYAQEAIVADSDSVLVWYDYDNLKKSDPGQEVWDVVLKCIDRGLRN